LGEHLYKKRQGFVEKVIGNEVVIVPLVGAVAQMEKVFSLNELGSFICNKLNNEMTKEQILDVILQEFDVDRTTADKDLEQFLENAVKSGIIEQL